MFTDSTSRADDLGQNLYLATKMTTASTPATPGPSTPTAIRPLPLDQLKVDGADDIVPPARPSSTPFPQQELLEGEFQSLRRLNEPVYFPSSAGFTNRMMTTTTATTTPISTPLHGPQANASSSPLCNLPIEIHECILDHLFGVRASASVRTMSPDKSKVLRSWGSVLRHCRRREVSELALVSNKWRHLVQDRLYRHLKIKGTRESVELSMMWFLHNPHLCSYVKHIEIWFPVFQQKNLAFDRTLRMPSTTPDRSLLIRSLANLEAAPVNETMYQSPSTNCTLEEIFRFVQLTFADVCVLTLEGGERKKPPMVRHFVDGSTTSQLPVIESIRTLVCKGQWNLIRSNEDFQAISSALPNVGEWHGSYAKPKSKSYLCMTTILPNLPRNLTHLNICLEGDYRREAVSPAFFRKVSLKTHVCVEMAKAIPTLEHLAYTGRVCHSFFDAAASLSNSRKSRLKSVDLIVKNVCRPTFQWNDGSGITDMAFILAFETLVLSGIRSLAKLSALDFLRIRFIDLESQIPPLNPYFQLDRNKCTGIWSDQIVEQLSISRPAAAFVEKSEDLADAGYDKDGRRSTTTTTKPNSSKSRPLSIKVSSYLAVSGGITIT